MTVTNGSLILYKNQPAIVRQTSEKKLTIELPSGEHLNVRPKDITLLHPGPIRNLTELDTVQGDINTAWELLDGQPTTLTDLAQLAFGDYTPSTAWAAWQCVNEGLFFSGTPDAIQPHNAAKREEILAARQAKAAEAIAWQAFMERAATRSLSADDERYLADIVGLALGRSETSRVLEQLGKPQTQESAHEFLLAAGYWTSEFNPYALRLGLPTIQPQCPIENLPEEPRRDLTHLIALAIDDEDSSDPDDAISVEGDHLWVHIADVAAVVRPDTPADSEARGRGANLYLPEGTIHMLPNELTQRLGLGLQPVSPALSFALSVRDTGEIDLLEIVPSWIKVIRTTYDAVEGWLDEKPFTRWLALSEKYRQRRIDNGAIEIELPEVKVRVDPTGGVKITPLPNLRSRQMVREAMLMVGEAVGWFGIAHDIPLAYTVQDPPQQVGFDRDGYAGMFAQRKAMMRSQPRTKPGRHAGLGLDVYVQATSPLRRYLDLVAHQQLRAYLRDEPMLTAAEVTIRIGTATAVTGAVRAAERLSNQHWILVYLSQLPNWEGQGIVVEQLAGKDIVLIPELAWEAEIFRRDPKALNSEVKLEIDHIDLPHRSARFRIK